MRSRSALILIETFPERLESVRLLAAAGSSSGGDPAALRQVASNLDAASTRFTDAKIGAAYAAYADLVRVAAMLVEWRRASLDAEIDPDRFKRGVLERLSIWRTENGERAEAINLADVARALGEVTSISQVGPLCAHLAKTPLPAGLYGDQQLRSIARPFADDQARDKEPPQDLHVAFLSFVVDGGPADQIHFLTPHETHDLEIEVRVSRWPDGIAELRLTPVTIEASTAYEFPQFTFAKPSGDPPFVMRQRGRATIRAAQAFRAQPFEFRYAAEFWPKDIEQPVSVVGHRTLRIESIDVQRSPLTGYPNMDQRLLDLRNLLRQTPAMPQNDLEAAMTLAVPLAGLAARSVQDNLFPEALDEQAFQTFVRDELRRHPQIGGSLDEHPHAGGGETDLSLKGIRLELKVERDRRLRLADCQRYVEQAAAYAVGSGKRIGLLCVLDGSSKDQAPAPAEDEVGVLPSAAGLPILTVLIQGSLAKPSALSRRGRKRSETRPLDRRGDHRFE